MWAGITLRMKRGPLIGHCVPDLASDWLLRGLGGLDDGPGAGHQHIVCAAPVVTLTGHKNRLGGESCDDVTVARVR